MMENTDWLDFTLALLIALLIGIGLILAYRLRILSQRSERWRSENEVARGANAGNPRRAREQPCGGQGKNQRARPRSREIE